jgi:hypothetical protein
MRDVHQMVINDAREIISGHSIGADSDKITDPGGIEIHLPVDEIFKKDRPFSHVKPGDRTEPRIFHRSNLRSRERTAPSVVPGHFSSGELFFSKFFEPLFRTKALITLSFLKQPIGKFAIGGQTLSLAVRAQWPASIGAFFPGDPQPSEIFHNSIHGAVGRSLYIRILNAENEGSLMPFCKEKIEESRPGISDMEKPGRSRGKANPNL